MKKKPYKRSPGDYEIRILKDGRIVMLAYDEKLVEIAEKLNKSFTELHLENGTKLCQKINQRPKELS